MVIQEDDEDVYDLPASLLGHSGPIVCSNSEVIAKRPSIGWPSASSFRSYYQLGLKCKAKQQEVYLTQS